MDVEQRRSGLVVPKAKPEPPKRRYGPTEIQGEEQRTRVAAALLQLWDAMELSGSGAVISSLEPTVWPAHYRLYRFVGEILLDNDCPEREVLT